MLWYFTDVSYVVYCTVECRSYKTELCLKYDDECNVISIVIMYTQWNFVFMWTNLVIYARIMKFVDGVKEQGEVQSSVQETLALLVDCFTDVDAACLAQLEALVLQNIEQVTLSFALRNYFCMFG